MLKAIQSSTNKINTLNLSEHSRTHPISKADECFDQQQQTSFDDPMKVEYDVLLNLHDLE